MKHCLILFLILCVIMGVFAYAADAQPDLSDAFTVLERSDECPIAVVNKSITTDGDSAKIRFELQNKASNTANAYFAYVIREADGTLDPIVMDTAFGIEPGSARTVEYALSETAAPIAFSAVVSQYELGDSVWIGNPAYDQWQLACYDATHVLRELSPDSITAGSLPFEIKGIYAVDTDANDTILVDLAYLRPIEGTDQAAVWYINAKAIGYDAAGEPVKIGDPDFEGNVSDKIVSIILSADGATDILPNTERLLYCEDLDLDGIEKVDLILSSVVMTDDLRITEPAASEWEAGLRGLTTLVFD